MKRFTLVSLIVLSVAAGANAYPWISPYAYCGWNPIAHIDPDGRRPIYSTDGELLGTDDAGLQGDAIVMNKDNFTQNMNSEEAMKLDLGTKSLTKEAYQKYYDNYSNLSSRPDWDGQLTLAEANNWYRSGDGKPLYVDASKVDLSPLTKSDFSAIGSSKYVNFLDPKNHNLQTGLVYGTIQITLISNDGAVRLGNKNGLLDVYNFDIQQGRAFRNFVTRIGSIVAGKGTPFNIYHYGQGKVK